MGRWSKKTLRRNARSLGYELAFVLVVIGRSDDAEGSGVDEGTEG